MPAANLEACLLNSAKQSKRGVLIKQALIIPENGTFNFPDENLAPDKLYFKKEYVDMRTVRVGQQKVVRTRPIFHDWKVTFTAYLDTDKLNPEELIEILENAGKYAGLGDYRPRYGRFTVVTSKINGK